MAGLALTRPQFALFVVAIGRVYRPSGRAFNLVGWASLALTAMHSLTACAVFPHG